MGGAVVVGASMGGTSAMCAAEGAGPLMKGLVLVDISIHNEPKGIDRIVNFMTGKSEFATLEEVGGFDLTSLHTSYLLGFRVTK